MTERALTLSTADGELDAWLYTPEGAGPWPGVILNTDIRGVRDTFRELAAQVADQGFAVLLPNLYYRVARPPVADPALTFQDEAGRRRFGELRNSLSADGLRRDHQALLDWLESRPEVAGRRFGIVGYCLSGAIAVQVAADFPERIAAAASFHGGNLVTDNSDSPHLRLGDIQARLHFGHAKDDASIPAEAIDTLDAALGDAGLAFTSTRYQARHGFAVPDSPAYDPDAGRQHLEELLDLLNVTLKTSA